jgi:hypothetical protein
MQAKVGSTQRTDSAKVGKACKVHRSASRFSLPASNRWQGCALAARTHSRSRLGEVQELYGQVVEKHVIYETSRALLIKAD